MAEKNTRWFEWMQEILAISRAGLTYTQNEFDKGRYQRLQEIAAEIGAFGADENVRYVKGIFAKETGYQTPKIDVRGAVFKEGKIVLVREKLDQDKWTLPGGWAETWDPPHKNVEREVLEETGLVVQATKLAAVYDRKTHRHTPELFNSYKMFFICEIVSGELQTSIETSEVKFFDKNEIPQEDEISVKRVRREQILRMFEHHRHPEIPTDFD